MGSPQFIVRQEVNLDRENRNAYHSMCYKGNFDCLIMFLNIERVYMKKCLFDELLSLKSRFRFKNMDIKHGKLDASVFHDEETSQRHQQFDVAVFDLLERYSKDITDRYKQILTAQDNKLKRNPIHYGAMSKFTKCYKTLEALLSIDIDVVPGTEAFLALFFRIQELEP